MWLGMHSFHDHVSVSRYVLYILHCIETQLYVWMRYKYMFDISFTCLEVMQYYVLLIA